MDHQFTSLMNDTLPELEESKRRLVLFLGDADEMLTQARDFARKTEKQIRSLFRADMPSLLQRPHFSEPPIQAMDEYQNSL